MKDALQSQPQQERSQESLSRILDATRRLLEDQLFSSITVSDIAREAGVSTGLLYSRFASKDDILPLLIREYMRDAREHLGELDPVQAGAESVGARVGILIERVRSMSDGSLGLLRAATARRVLEPQARSPDEVRLGNEIRALGRDWLAPAAADVRREDPERALDFVNWIVFLAAQIAPMVAEDEQTVTALMHDLAEAMQLYLTAPAPASTGSGELHEGVRHA